MTPDSNRKLTVGSDHDDFNASVFGDDVLTFPADELQTIESLLLQVDAIRSSYRQSSISTLYTIGNNYKDIHISHGTVKSPQTDCYSNFFSSEKEQSQAVALTSHLSGLDKDGNLTWVQYTLFAAGWTCPRRKQTTDALIPKSLTYSSNVYVVIGKILRHCGITDSSVV